MEGNISAKSRLFTLDQLTMIQHAIADSESELLAPCMAWSRGVPIIDVDLLLAIEPRESVVETYIRSLFLVKDVPLLCDDDTHVLNTHNTALTCSTAEFREAYRHAHFLGTLSRVNKH